MDYCRGAVRQPKEEVTVILLDNGHLSITPKSGLSGPSISLCDSECISLESGVVLIEYQDSKIHLSSPKKILMNNWYDTAVEVLNNLGFNFPMQYDHKNNRKVAQHKQIKPKQSSKQPKRKLSKDINQAASSDGNAYYNFGPLPNIPTKKPDEIDDLFGSYEYEAISEYSEHPEERYEPIDEYQQEDVIHTDSRTKLIQQVKQKIKISIEKKKLDGKITLSMKKNRHIFIASLDPSLRHNLYEGDMVLTINNQHIDSVEEAINIYREHV
ncbi:uncharacterized protein [Antedon mediterranea]|uniref:uncharacterized protein n=1 Tax=Antedon mediterranea TaxID=105859 RepID=UPI003AF68C05